MIARTLTSLIAASCIGLSFSTVANAQQEPADRIASLIERLDLNGDGGIDASEVEQARVEAFATMDLNADGFVERSEAEDLVDAAGLGAGERAGRFGRGNRDPFARLDSNDDGMVSRDEYVGQPVRIMNADADGDGIVTSAEMETMITSLRGRFGGGRQQ